MIRLLLSVAACCAVLGVAGLAACGPTQPELGGPCASTCDCTRTDAPLRCPGEWTCNADQTCEYTCGTPCSGEVYTCPDLSDCNGTLCSFRKVAGCG